MSTIRRQSIFSLIFIYAGFIIGAFNILFLFPKYFTTEQFGLTRLLLELGLLFSTICTAGMVPVSIKFFPFHKKYLPNKKNDLLILTLTINIIALIVMLLILPNLKPWIIRKFGFRSPLFIEYFNLIYPLTITMTLFNLFEAYAWNLGKTILSNFLKEFLFRFITTFLIIAWIGGWIGNFKHFINMFSYSYLPPLLLLAFTIFRSRQFGLSTGISNVTKRLGTKMAGFGIVFYASSILNAIAKTNDTIILASQSNHGLSDTAIYNIGTYLITLLEVPQRSLTSSATSHIAIAWKERNFNRLSSIYQKTALNLLIIGLGLFGVILLNINELIMFLGPTYSSISAIIIILGISKLIDLGTGMNSQILVLSKHWKIDIFSNILFVIISLVLNYYLTQVYGIKGPAFGTLIAIIFFNFIRFVAIWKIYKLQPFSWNNLHVILIAGISFCLVWIIPKFENLYVNVFFNTVFFAVIYGILVFKLKVSSDINELIHLVRKRFTNFKS